MSTHDMSFYEDLTKKYLSIIVQYHQIRTLSVLNVSYNLQFLVIILNSVFMSVIR